MVAGGFVPEGGHIGTVVDTGVLWLNARVPEGQRLNAAKVYGGAFRIGTGPWHAIPESDAGYDVSAVLDDLDRTFPLRIPLANPEGALPAGAHTVVDLAISPLVETLTVDKRSVVFEQGVPSVFVMTEGERFERIQVHLGAEHGGHVEVKGGIEPGRRVATVGAIYVKLAALGGGDAIGHGHAH